ncbi:hypothetical protein ScPMuIL_002817 [Solemya velum]
MNIRGLLHPFSVICVVFLFWEMNVSQSSPTPSLSKGEEYKANGEVLPLANKRALNPFVVAKIFIAMSDKDGDDLLTVNELTKFYETNGFDYTDAVEIANGILSIGDLDGDGSLNVREFIYVRAVTTGSHRFF